MNRTSTTSYDEYINFGTLKVLIVDDSKASALFLKHQLKQLGVPLHNIHCAHNYQTALKQVTYHYYDIILLDFHLEQCISGCELGVLMRQKGLINHHTGVILVTSDPSQQTVMTILSSQFQHLITKPLKLKTLQKKITAFKQELAVMQQLEPWLSQSQLSKPDIKIMLELTQQTASPVVIESAILERLCEQKKWSSIALLMQQSQSAPHMIKVFVQAEYLIAQRALQQAKQLLCAYLAFYPLAPRLFDQLTQIYRLENNHQQAFIYARKALALTPGNPNRLSTLCQCSSHNSSAQALKKEGQAYALHFSIIDPNWLSAIISYSEYLQSTYAVNDKQQRSRLYQHLTLFYKTIRNKLVYQQKKQLDALQHCIFAKLLYADNQYYIGHTLFYAGLMPFYHKLSSLPIKLKQHLIETAALYNEPQLINKISHNLSLNPNNPTHLDLLDFQQDRIIQQALADLTEQLRFAKQYLHNKTVDTACLIKVKKLYQQIIKQHPTCTQALIGYLVCTQQLANPQCSTLSLSLEHQGLDIQDQQILDHLTNLHFPSSWLHELSIEQTQTPNAGTNPSKSPLNVTKNTNMIEIVEKITR